MILYLQSSHLIQGGHFDLCRLLTLFVPGDQQLLKHLLEVPVLQVYLEVPGVQIVLSPPLVLVFRNSQVILVARTVLAVQEDHVLLLNLPDLEVLEDQVLLELRDGRFLQECLESLACLERLVVLIYQVDLFPQDLLLAQPAL